MAVGTVRGAQAGSAHRSHLSPSIFLEEGMEAQTEHKPGAGLVGGGQRCWKHRLCTCRWVTLGEAGPSLSLSLLI